MTWDDFERMLCWMVLWSACDVTRFPDPEPFKAMVSAHEKRWPR